MSYSQPGGGTLTTNHTTQEISPNTGAASFTNIQFCGDNNSSYALTFTAQPPVGSTLTGFQVFCSVYLFGCSGANQEVVTSESSCDHCVAGMYPPRRRANVGMLIG